MSGLTYKESGVDVEAGDRLVDRIKPLAARTRIPEVLAGVGGFAGLCALPSGMKEPILVSGTDGVGTKLKVAIQTGRHDTVGIDLVAMCVNDVITCGARPLFFLDYFATGRLDVGTAERVIAGIARGCEEAGCALLGGETAEMPGFYADGEYDLAGFSVGVVEKSAILDGSRVRPGDAVIGVASSGLHSNGYSLVRKALERAGIGWQDTPPELGGQSVIDAVIAPTRIYARAAKALLAAIDVHAMAHITGGGLPGNVPRVLPPDVGVEFVRGSWPRPKVFDLVQRAGAVSEEEMLLAFNVGLGLVVVVAESDAPKALETLAAQGEQAFLVGRLVAMPGARDEACVRFVG
jgi:phosphoribosylformylglycinamidine cyclo-ligase